MATVQRIVCRADELIERGDGVRFEVKRYGRDESAFVIRFAGKVRGFLNRCAHVPTELDWNPGKFFDADSTLLICSTHGALYAPDSGRCVGGPCRGRSLTELVMIERDGLILVEEIHDE